MSQKVKHSLAAFFLLFTVAVIFYSCKSDDPAAAVECVNGALTIQELNASSALSPPIDTNKTVNLIITSEQQFSRYIANRTQTIDFDKYMLLVGSYYTDSAAHVASKTVISDCTGRSALFHVDIIRTKGVSTTRNHVEYFAIVPKLPDGTQVKFDIAYKQ